MSTTTLTPTQREEIRMARRAIDFMLPRPSRLKSEYMGAIDRIEDGTWTGLKAAQYLHDAAYSVRGHEGFPPSQYDLATAAVATPKASPATPKAIPRPRADFLGYEIVATMPRWGWDRKGGRIIPAECLRFSDLAFTARHDGPVLARQSWGNLAIWQEGSDIKLVAFPYDTAEARAAVDEIRFEGVLGISPAGLTETEDDHGVGRVVDFELTEISLAKKPCLVDTKVWVNWHGPGVVAAMAAKVC